MDERRTSLGLALVVHRPEALKAACRLRESRANAAEILNTVIDRCLRLPRWDTGLFALTDTAVVQYQQFMRGLDQALRPLKDLEILEAKGKIYLLFGGYLTEIIKAEDAAMSRVLSGVIVDDAARATGICQVCLQRERLRLFVSLIFGFAGVSLPRAAGAIPRSIITSEAEAPPCPDEPPEAASPSPVISTTCAAPWSVWPPPW
jgi:hypothetical protein